MKPPLFIRSLAGLAAVLALAAPGAAAQRTERVSLNSVGQQGNDPSYEAAMSADGRFVAFRSYAGNLVPGDTNAASDVFVHDRQTGQTERVSVDSAGAQANSTSWAPAISADGRYVAYVSRATNLVTGDLNGFPDVFVHDRQTGQTSCVSRSSAGAAGNDGSYEPALSADGMLVAFESRASNLAAGDTNGKSDVFVHDRQTGQTARVSVDSAGAEAAGASLAPALSADGLFVAFESDAADLVAADGNGVRDVFLHDRQTGATVRVSVNTPGTEGNGASAGAALGASGGFVAFHSSATNLVLHDRNNQDDVFVHDLVSGKTGRVSVDSQGKPGNRGSNDPAVSADGRFVAFRSGATDLVAGDTNGCVDVFVHDHRSGQTRRVSVSSHGTEGDDSSFGPALSADARFVAFFSYARTLVPRDSNDTRDVFVHDTQASGPFLSRSGFCPGNVSITVTGATPGGWVALVYGPNAGSFIKPGPPCQGLKLSIGAPALRRQVVADAAGRVGFVTGPSSAVCGTSLQVVDVTSCVPSNVVVL